MKKKVAFLIPSFDPGGGAEKVLLNLVNNMDHQKFDITVIALFGHKAMTDLLNENVKFKAFLNRPFRGNSKIIGLLPAGFLYNIMVKDNYDIVIAYLEGTVSHIASGCNQLNTKKIAWIHIELNDKKHYKSGFGFFKRAVSEYASFNQIVCVSDTVKKAFINTAGYQFPKIDVLYNTNETNQIIQRANEPIADVVFNSKEVNIISVAKIMDSKGFDRLARVHKRLVEEGYNHHIYILGIGEKKKEIEQYLIENGIEERFTFLGFRENPYKYVKEADLYVCSSRREGFSTAVTEALIVGTPVVSTNCSGAVELLGENNEYGIVIENNEDGIYQGLKKMLDDEGLRKYYSQKALERAEKFSTRNTVKAVEEMLLSL